MLRPQVGEGGEVAGEGCVDEGGDPLELGGIGGGVFFAEGGVCWGEGVGLEGVEGESGAGYGEEVALVLGVG